MTAPLGVILAGGRATRMGGGDKGFLALGGERLLDRVIRRLDPQVSGIVINANGDRARFSEFGLPVIPDSLPGWPGPLAGVLAGMDWAAEHGASQVVTVAADSPFFPADLVARLTAAGGTSGLALAASPSGRQPTFGLWPVALREDLRDALRSGLRKVVLWTGGHGAGIAEFPDDRAFFNVNTPEDLVAAEAMV